MQAGMQPGDAGGGQQFAKLLAFRPQGGGSTRSMALTMERPLCECGCLIHIFRSLLVNSISPATNSQQGAGATAITTTTIPAGGSHSGSSSPSASRWISLIWINMVLGFFPLLVLWVRRCYLPRRCCRESALKFAATCRVPFCIANTSRTSEQQHTTDTPIRTPMPTTCDKRWSTSMCTHAECVSGFRSPQSPLRSPGSLTRSPMPHWAYPAVSLREKITQNKRYLISQIF